MAGAVAALFWGLVSGSALVLGAATAYFATVSPRVIGAVMAFGSGVLISALSFDLMEKAYAEGGFTAVAVGFLSGATIYTGVNVALSQWGAKHRKRSGDHQPADVTSGVAIAVGALLDGIPESLVIGVSILAGGKVSLVAVSAIFLSNFPEGLSSAAGMKRAGRPATFIFTVWIGIALLSGVAAWAGYSAFAGYPPIAVAGIEAVAAGAILAMIADTMIPEATEVTRDFTGLITVAGFLAAFALSKFAS
jgi:ZIP family zinc transporter